MADDLGEHDKVAERSDLDDGCTIARVTDEIGADAPVVFTADLCGMSMIMPSAYHQGLVLRAEGNLLRTATILSTFAELFI